MIAELIASKEQPSVGLKVKVASIDMAFPKSLEEMEEHLTRHVLSCRHCLAMALFRKETLAETGCAEYISLLGRMHSVLQVQSAIANNGHVDENALEEYCFNRLSAEEASSLEDHVLGCLECAEKLEDRFEFISCMKNCLTMLDDAASAPGLRGILAVRCPERKMNLYAKVGG